MAANKRKKDHDTGASKRAKTDDQFLDSFKIYLHPAALSKGRKTIFEKKVTELGGEPVLSLEKLSQYSGAITVLIEDGLIDKSRIPGLIQKCETSIPKDTKVLL